MGVQITIRDVPEAVRDELASRAALQGRSMQEYLRYSLTELAARPSPEQWLDRVRQRKSISATRLSSKDILEAKDSEKR